MNGVLKIKFKALNVEAKVGNLKKGEGEYHLIIAGTGE